MATLTLRSNRAVGVITIGSLATGAAVSWFDDRTFWGAVLITALTGFAGLGFTVWLAKRRVLTVKSEQVPN